MAVLLGDFMDWWVKDFGGTVQLASAEMYYMEGPDAWSGGITWFSRQ
jgi:hypothetical protein